MYAGTGVKAALDDSSLWAGIWGNLTKLYLREFTHQDSDLDQPRFPPPPPYLHLNVILSFPFSRVCLTSWRLPRELSVATSTLYTTEVHPTIDPGEMPGPKQVKKVDISYMNA